VIDSGEQRIVLEEIPEELAVIPINDGVVYPYMLIPLILTDENLIRLIDEALADRKIIGVFTQKDQEVANPGIEDIYQTGCALLIQKMGRFPDGHVRIVGQGLSRIRIVRFTDDFPFMRARVEILEEGESDDDRTKALMRNVINAFFRIVDSSESYSDEIKGIVSNIKEAGKLTDMLAANLNIEIAKKQQVLETIDPSKRLSLIYEYVSNEIEILKIGEKIKKDVRKEMDREQREYYLRQQIRAIQRELGEDDATVELEELKEQVERKEMPEEARAAATREVNRLQKMSPNSAEYTVSRTYLYWLLELPWQESTDDIMDIAAARRVLDRDHYDLDQVKERILEFLSVKKLKKSVMGSIICFVGPPGVGKTSLGRSIASALGRRFVRISLGGVRDEAEIRGHRRTYVGALPGRIIQSIKTSGSNNPVFMLDEIDKLGSDFRGDPAAALLEVLDPEQNHSFEDHYIGLPFDLSRVMFITTANVRDTIPSPLLDRMEVLDLPGYITSEKLHIAKRFLVPRQMEQNGLPAGKLVIQDNAINTVIENYTREAGVRALERRIAAIARKTAKKIAEGKRGPYRVTQRNLRQYLGAQEYPGQEILPRPEVGVATGMARSTAGGVILFIEVLKIKGRGTLKLTGHLGEVMKESAEAAMSFVKSYCNDGLVEEDFFETYDIHLHIPAGAVPKDGPSAGIAIATSLASLATGRKVRNDVSMTGEITLTGKVLPVGGIKDKVIAAYRAGIREVILPTLNRKDLEERPDKVKKRLRFTFVDKVDEGIKVAIVGGRRTRRTRSGRGRRHA
jgi:ATP-dependent Lon protease